jgi:hypothetical protein
MKKKRFKRVPLTPEQKRELERKLADILKPHFDAQKKSLLEYARGVLK